MLILSRKLGERIVVGENIEITVTDLEPGKVRLGFKAPKEVKILRQELVPVAGNAGPQAVEAIRTATRLEAGQSPRKRYQRPRSSRRS